MTSRVTVEKLLRDLGECKIKAEGWPREFAGFLVPPMVMAEVCSFIAGWLDANRSTPATPRTLSNESGPSGAGSAGTLSAEDARHVAEILRIADEQKAYRQETIAALRAAAARIEALSAEVGRLTLERDTQRDITDREAARAEALEKALRELVRLRDLKDTIDAECQVVIRRMIEQLLVEVVDSRAMRRNTAAILGLLYPNKFGGKAVRDKNFDEYYSCKQQAWRDARAALAASAAGAEK